MKPIKYTRDARLNYGDVTIFSEMIQNNHNPTHNQYSDAARKKRIKAGNAKHYLLKADKNRAPSLPALKFMVKR